VFLPFLTRPVYVPCHFPNGITAEHGLQLTTYAMITPGASGLCRLDTVTKTKTVQVIQQTYEVGPQDRRFAETLYPMVQDSIREGLYPAAPQQSVVLPPPLRLLEPLRARVRRKSA
jgi:hypothetical protein